MNRKNKNKNLLIIIFIILIVSVTFIAAKFGIVSAEKTENTNIPVSQVRSEIENPAPILNHDSGSITSSLFKLLGALIVVVIGIYGFLYILRRMMGSKLSGNKRNKLLEVIETTYVAPKKSVSLVRFCDRTVLIGVGENNISILAELDSDETAKILAGSPDSLITGKSSFKNLLSDAKTRIMGFNLKGVRILSNSKNADTQVA